MIPLAPHRRILAAVEPADCRNGIDALVRRCREQLSAELFSGAADVFLLRGGGRVSKAVSHCGDPLPRAAKAKRDLAVFTGSRPPLLLGSRRPQRGNPEMPRALATGRSRCLLVAFQPNG